MTTETNVPAPNKSIPDHKPTRATPIPQGYDRILAGALKLTLKERASIAKKLIETNTTELARRAEELKIDQQAANGTA